MPIGPGQLISRTYGSDETSEDESVLVVDVRTSHVQPNAQRVLDKCESSQDERSDTSETRHDVMMRWVVV